MHILMATEVTFQSSLIHGAILFSGDLAIQPVDYILVYRGPHALCENGHDGLFVLFTKTIQMGPNQMHCVSLSSTQIHM